MEQLLETVKNCCHDVLSCIVTVVGGFQDGPKDPRPLVFTRLCHLLPHCARVGLWDQ